MPKAAVSLLTLVILVLSAGGTVAESEVSGTPGQLDGWQKAKFGMRPDEVRQVYPSEEAGIKFDGLVPMDRPPYSCSHLELTKYDLGRDRFDVEFDFDKGKEVLVKIRLTLHDTDDNTWQHYTKVLTSKYGPGNTTVEDQTDQRCSELHRKWQFGALRTAELFSNRRVSRTQFTLSGGYVVLVYSAVRKCDWIDSESSNLPAHRLESQEDLMRNRRLEIEYVSELQIDSSQF